MHETCRTGWAKPIETMAHNDVLLRRYRRSDLAIKVVGVDSVKSRCFIVPMSGRDGHDPFSLQIKEAGRSVRQDHLPDDASAEGSAP